MIGSFNKSFIIAVALATGLVGYACCAGVAAGQVVSAAEDPSLTMPEIAVSTPTTQPTASESHAAPETPGHHRLGAMDSADGSRMRDGHEGNHTRLPFEQPSADEWKKISAFMEAHSPRRWSFFSNLPESQRRHVMTIVATHTYRNFQKATAQDPKLGDIIMKQIEAQDAVFGDINDMRKARRANNAALMQTLATKVHSDISSMTDLGFQERQLRIDLLQKTIDNLKTRLDADKKNRDGLIGHRVRSVMGGMRWNTRGDRHRHGSSDSPKDRTSSSTAVN